MATIERPTVYEGDRDDALLAARILEEEWLQAEQQQSGEAFDDIDQK